MSVTLVPRASAPRARANPPQRAIRTVRIALAGCGTVGAAFVRLLRDRADALERSHRLRFDIPRVLVRDPRRIRDAELPRDRFTYDPRTLIDERTDVVVEATGGIEPLGVAREILSDGRAFVTANKALVAAHGAELAELARGTRASFRFEAAVGGGVPVVRTVRELSATSSIRSIRGILNGTSNFVLTRLECGDSLDSALDAARARGLAEWDVSRDLDGRDAADKIAILAWLAFGVAPDQLRVETHGLLPDPVGLVRDASAAGRRVRLIAECRRTDSGIEARVGPIVLDRDDAFARTFGEENRIEIDAGWRTPIALRGPGAGGSPTAAALLADLLEVVS